MRIGVLFAGLAVVLSGAACGDDDAGDAGDGAPSSTEFARQANALCADAAASRRTVLSATESTDLTIEQVDEIIAIDEKLLADVDDLVPPESAQDAVFQLLDEWRVRIDLEEQARTAVADGDDAELSTLQGEVADVDLQANQIAGGLLLNECTRGQS